MLKPAEIYCYLQLLIILNGVSIVARVVGVCLAVGHVHILQRAHRRFD